VGVLNNVYPCVKQICGFFYQTSNFTANRKPIRL
jgi:hypothetical protein